MTSTPSIFPKKRLITVDRNGEPADIAVHPFRIFGDMQAVRDNLPKLAPFVLNLAAKDYLGALSEAAEPCLALVALATRLPPADIAGLEADDQLALVVATFEVNVDFFLQRLAPALVNVTNLLVPAAMTSGPGAAPAFQDMTQIPAAPETPTTPGPIPPTA